jgi:hypothetical protein
MARYSSSSSNKTSPTPTSSCASSSCSTSVSSSMRTSSDSDAGAAEEQQRELKDGEPNPGAHHLLQEVPAAGLRQEERQRRRVPVPVIGGASTGSRPRPAQKEIGMWAGEPRKRSACRGGRRNRNEVFFLSGDKWGNFLSNMTKKLKMSNCEALILLLYKNCEIRINFIFFLI